MINTFYFSLLTSFIIVLILTPVIRNYFISKSFIEDPLEKQAKTNNATATTKLPRGGGLSIFLGIFLSLIIFLPLDKHLIGIILALCLTLLVGVWDDIHDVSPKIRLFTNLLAAVIVVSSGVGIAYISNPFGGIIDLSFLQYTFDFFGTHSIWILSDILAIIWIVWCMNITGWSGGVEGQLPGFVGISALFIGFVGLKYSQDISQWPLIIFSAIVTGSYFGFLPYNFHPQSIMIGYSGKSIAGLSLAILSILSGAKLATLFLLMAIPMLDAIFVIVRRFIQRKSLVRSDGQHLHHQLLKLGWSSQKIAIFYWAVSLFMGIITLYLNTQQKIIVSLFILIIFSFSLATISRRI
ncbi:MAG: MraY family glycosyltransferase [Microgenomates group bacterium]